MLSKKFYFFLLFSLALTFPILAQHKHPTTCNHKRHQHKIPTLQELTKQRKSLSKGNKGNIVAAGVGTTAIVQSVHNTIAKWESGSFFRFDIGTTPGANDIHRGNLLATTAKNTQGHSYEELRRTALAQGTIFNLGDTFYINLYDYNTDPNPWVSQPLSFNVETLGAAANEVTIDIEMGYGVNGLGPFAAWQRDKMQEFYSRVNPIIKEVYGPPSRNHTIHIVNDGLAVGTNTYYNGPNQISTTYSEIGGDLSQPRLMIHELVHGYRDNVIISSNDEWHYTPVLSGFEEGMAEAVALIVMDIFIERYPNFFNSDEFKIHWGHSRGMPFDWDYDFQNHEQLTTTDFFSSDIGTGAHWERYGAAQTVMQKMYIEDNDIFKKFNTEYYRRLTADYTLLPTRDMVINIFESILPNVERTPVAEWINKQRILDCKVVPGKKVHMLTFQQADQARISTTDNRLHIYETQNNVNGSEWSWDVILPRIDPFNDPSERWYVQSNNINGQLQIYNYDGTLHQAPINIRNDKAARTLGVAPYLGPYQGPNVFEYNGVFTANDGAGVGPQPGGGKRPQGIENHNFTVTNTPNRAHADLFNANNQPDPATQLISGLETLGLYRYEISFEGGNYAGTYYRLHGTDLVEKDGLFGGIKSENDANQIKGKLIIEHEDFGEEPEIIINNGAFIQDRLWTSIPAVPARQGGRTDRRYSAKGKVHAIYVSEDCTQQKIDFRNITYGDGLAGSQLFLFTVENFQDIEYTPVPEITVCKNNDFTLDVNNNFSDILDGDSRITFQWLNPLGVEIATTKTHVFNNAQNVDQGIYTLKIDFFGCEIIKTVNVIVTDDTFTVTTPPTLTICENNTINIAANDIPGATYAWTGPNSFTANTRDIQILNAPLTAAGDYIVSATIINCSGVSETLTSTTTVTVNTNVSPTFSFTTNYCLSATPDILPTTSDNGITGSWNIATIDTSTAGTTNYVFTPNDPNQCGEVATIPVTINNTPVSATFSFATTYCENATPAALPTTSDNGINGTWNTPTIDTSILGTTNYIFTPTIVSPCNQIVTIPVTVNAIITPIFSFATTYCESTTPSALPTTSDNGIDGTWNVATIDTSITGATNYVFTPNVPSQCGEIATVSVTVNPTVTPTFTFATTYCESATPSALPTTSDNGIDGTWNVATIDTSITGATNYVFTPNVPSQCGEVVTVSVTVNPTVTPTFTFATTYCESATPSALPTTSDNGIDGTWNVATIDTSITGATNYVFTPNVPNQCGEVATVSVTITPTVTPTFTFATTYCESATPSALPTTSDNGIDGTWNVATIDTSITGATNYVFTPNVPSQCGEVATVSVTVNPTVTPTFTFATTYCESATPSALPTTSDNGIDGTWNVATIDTSIIGTTNYVFTPNVPSQCGEVATVSVTVNPTVTPTFTFTTTYCESATPSALPTTSDNGIDGTWNVATIDTSITGATNYVFTPNVPNQCGEVVTISVTVTPTVTPTFTFTTTYCESATPSALPTTSDNGIDGTWNVATIDTSITGATNYVFTPNVPNQCGEVATVSVTVNPTVTPTFTFATTYCESATPSALPIRSDNGIDGTWNVATIDTSTTGTTNYVFTPNVPSQCGEVATVSVTITPTVTPTFTFATTYCESATPSALPTTSDNGIDGTWNVATIDTSITGATNYVFTPNVPNQCGEVATVSVTVTPTVTPTFTFATTYCESATPSTLPTTSDNGIDGTWNVAGIDTSITGATNYVFTPNVPNQCGEVATVSVTVNPTVTPTFTFTTAYCESATPSTLPTTSDNGIDGTWNIATIDTSILGVTNYVFTPNVPSQCGEVATVSVTVDTSITPTFTFATTYCESATPNALPTRSDNGIDGTWNVAGIDTSITGATNYVFTPNVPNQCGEVATISVTVTPTVTPTFTFTTTYCESATPSALPTRSDNGIDGTWNVAGIDTSITGVTNYIFTPNVPSQCGEVATVSVTVNPTVTPTFTFTTAYCESATPSTLPTTSDNGIDGTWNVATIDTSTTGVTNYVFTPNVPSQCGEVATVSVTVNPTVTPTFTFATTYCENATPDLLPTTSVEGIDGTWNVAGIDTSITGATNYVFTPNVPSQCGEVVTISVTVNPTVTPTFTFTTTYCENATPDLLPTRSDNGIDGTWNVAGIDTSITGATNYVFTPNVPSQCGEVVTISVTVNPTVTPTFTFTTTYCESATPDLLPTTSVEGIDGTWNVAGIDTSITGATNYVFTPNVPSQCGEIATVSVTVNPTVTPTFTFTTTYCESATPDLLPTTSVEGIDGTWNVATIDTSIIGTTNYVFTPNVPNQCGTALTIPVTVNATVTPTFTFATTYCENATPDLLPTTSVEGIDGTWNVAGIDTSITGATNYVFTPNVPSQCGEVATVSVTVNPTVTPTFTFTTTYCEGATPDLLPTTSVEGIDGTWNVAGIDTSITGATNYVFTPNVPSQCGEVATVSVTVNPTVTPTFTFATTYCESATPSTLPTRSDNGIDGTWNVATIDTSIIGTTNYVFTPNVPSQCGTALTIPVTINATVTPTFTFTTTYCENATPDLLPTTSVEGIDGTWNVAGIDTSITGATNYVFTPNVPSQCGEIVTISVTVNPTVTPTFTFATTYCESATPSALPTRSDNGIDGTWNVAGIDTSITGATNYVFTPNVPSQCGEVATVSVTVNPTVTPTFTFTTTYCENGTPDILPTTSFEGIDGTWSAATIDTSTTGTTNYVFTPTTPSQCGEVATVSVTVNPTVTPTFTFTTTYCENATPDLLPTTSVEGIDGTWNVAGIDTSITGATNYVFTPNVPSQCGEVATVSVTVNPTATPTFTFTTTYCESETPDLLPTTSVEGIDGTWNVAGIDTSITGATNYVFTPNVPSQCGEVATVSVTVNQNSFTLAPTTPITICATQTLSIIAENISGATYSWTGPNGFTAVTKDIQITNATTSESGDYTVSVTKTSCLGVIETKQVTTTVTVNENTFTINQTPTPIEVCETEDLLLSIDFVDSATYQWSGPNGFTATTREVTIPNVTSNDAGNYTVIVSALNCIGTLETKTSTTNVVINETFKVIAPSTFTTCFAEEIAIDVNDIAGATYSWTGPNGFTANTKDILISNATLAMEGEYTVSVTAPNCMGTMITETSTTQVFVNICAEIPQYFTPNEDGRNDTWEIDSAKIPFSYINIYDRYGKVLKIITPQNNSWDGYYNGKKMPSTDYWYLIEYLNQKQDTGHFSLLRK